MTQTFRIAALAVIACFGIAIGQDPKKPAKNGLDGLYSVTAGEKDGKEIPPDKLKGLLIKFDGDKVMGTDKDKKVFFGSTFTIDKTTSPYTITMTSTAPKAGEKAMGIIEMKGDTVKLCYALGCASRFWRSSQAAIHRPSHSGDSQSASNSTNGPTCSTFQRAPVRFMRKLTSCLTAPSTAPLPMLNPDASRPA